MKLTPKEAYTIGQVVDFKVKKNHGTYCELIDEANEITSYLQRTQKLSIFNGQMVKCRILAVVEKHPKIELVNIAEFVQGKDSLTQEKLHDLLAQKEYTWNIQDFSNLLLTDEKDLPFEAQCHRWIQNLLDKNLDLAEVRSNCFELLELSQLLNICSFSQREFYQDRMSIIIEQLGFYIKAAKLIANEGEGGNPEKTPKVFIDNLLEKLRVSGFVYHPSRNFNILSSLFLCRPDIMNSRISELLEIIYNRDIRIWQKEPFCSALIKLLELYIRQCDGLVDRTKDNKKLIDNISQALALQLLLIESGGGKSSAADERLNATRLCIISSYSYPLNPQKLVEAAYSCLFQSEYRFIKYSLEKDNYKFIPYYITIMPRGAVTTVNSFTQGRGRLLVKPEGIQLVAPYTEYEVLYPVFPASMELWKNMQVYLTRPTDVNLADVSAFDLKPYQTVWAEIEHEFFDVRPSTIRKPKYNKRHHMVGDSVQISFVAQDEANRNKYYCRIEDEIGGEGEIIINEIVPYSVQSSLRHFFDYEGNRLVFDAHIIRAEGDHFYFSMITEVKNRVSDIGIYNYDQSIICSLGGSPNGNMAPAISREGVSVSIINANQFPGVGRDSIVSCRLIGQAKGTFHILCEIDEVIDYQGFDVSESFKTLLNRCAIDYISETIAPNDEEQILESDRLLDESYVKELIFMIDRMALLEKDYMRAFNYLGFARVGCLLIGWEEQAAYYKGRMDIIAMLHYFAKNSKVDEDKLKQLENVNAELFSSNVVLRERFMQLQAVSFIDKPDHNEELFALSNNNPGLKELSSLVLAYNITKASGMESTALDIHNKIKQKLNLKGFESGLKFYGNEYENELVEYKTSIVYYAGDSVAIPNMEMQMAEILKVISSFLNTKGGTLYIGVNDTGYGVGVEDDLNSSEFYGDKDKYIRTIIDAVAIRWGNSMATNYLGEVDFDKENTEKPVLIVKIKPYKGGVPFDDVFYVRKGGTKRSLTREEFDEYQRTARVFIDKPVETPNAKIAEILEQPVEENVSEPVETNKPFVSLKDDEVRTSRIRHNVPAEFIDPDNYVEPIALFKFTSGGNFQKLNQYDFDTENTLLTLTVTESEENGYLMLGYENGHIVRVPVRVLLEYGANPYARNTDSKLVFASIANEDDAILSILVENKRRGKTVVRLDDIDKFEEGRLGDVGETPCNENLLAEVLAYDIIPAREKASFSSILNQRKTTVGSPSNASILDIINKLHLWGINEI